MAASSKCQSMVEPFTISVFDRYVLEVLVLTHDRQRASYPGKTLKAYPEGFRMIAGNPERRDYNNSIAEQAISHVCLDYTGPAPVPEGPPLPSKPCPNGVRSQVYFPSCWDGKNLDSDDHTSHMAYPSAYNSGVCPDSHPEPMISIFYEFIFGTDHFADGWYGNKQPFVYAMGDDTGYGLHGDFVSLLASSAWLVGSMQIADAITQVNGWDVNILQNGIDKKTSNDAGCASDVTCDGIFQYPDSYGETCTLPPLIDEAITGVLEALPGCNPVSDNPVPVTDCNATSTLGVDTSKIYTDVTKTLDWAYLGCGTDNYYARALPTQLADSKTMTVETCVKMCSGAGYSIAGLEYSSQCFCGNSMPASASPTPGVVGDCNAACAGNSNQVCGDASRLSLYKKCTEGSCQNAQYGLVGEVGSLGGSVATTAPSSPPATSVSVAAHQVTSITSTPAEEYPSSVASARPVATTVSSVIVAPTASSAPSGGSSGSNTTDLPSGWKSAGCYSDSLDSRALTGIHLAYYGIPITASNCAAYCDKEGFSMAGVEFAGQCFCGNNLQGGSSQVSNDKCNMPCAGDASQTCGGSLALNIATKSSTTRRRAHLRRHHVAEAGKV